MNGSAYPIAVLAGGLATRLRPMTQTIPKALIDINGEPFIAHQLRLFRDAGLTRVVLCVGYLGEMIQEVIGEGSRFGLRVDYSFDGPTLLGTAGAIRKALPMLGESFFVIYGDSYLACDYLAVQQAFDAGGRRALMTVFRNEGRFDTSNVEYADGRIIEYDKRHRTPRMHHIDYGLGVFSHDVFETVPLDRPTDLADLYRQLLRQGELTAFEAAQRFYEIGSLDGIEEIRRFLAAAHPEHAGS